MKVDDARTLSELLQAAECCPVCGGQVQWYLGHFGAAWWEAEYGRCEGGCHEQSVVQPHNPENVIRRAYDIGILIEAKRAEAGRERT